MAARTLTDLADILACWPLERAVIIDMTDLRRRPVTVIRAALARLTITEDAALANHLDNLHGGSGSTHHHRVDSLAINATHLKRCLNAPYERLLALPHRIEASP
jgi:hypothetical protein